MWDGRPTAATTGSVVDPVLDTPTHIAVAGGAGSAPPGAKTSDPRACLRVSLSRRTIPVRRKAKLVATVRRDGHRVAGVRVVVKGKGLMVGARTDKKGTAKISVRARRAERLKVNVRGQKAGCPAPTVRAR